MPGAQSTPGPPVRRAPPSRVGPLRDPGGTDARGVG